MFSGHPLVAGLFVWKKRPQRGWVAGAGAVIPMRQAGQPGACVNAPLRPPVPEANTIFSRSQLSHAFHYRTDVASFPLLYRRKCPD